MLLNGIWKPKECSNKYPASGSLNASVAKLADAHASGACDRKVIEVQILSEALKK